MGNMSENLIKIDVSLSSPSQRILKKIHLIMCFCNATILMFICVCPIATSREADKLQKSEMYVKNSSIEKNI
jgi:hypothetical protein